jgi:hypothetical protein
MMNSKEVSKIILVTFYDLLQLFGTFLVDEQPRRYVCVMNTLERIRSLLVCTNE